MANLTVEQVAEFDRQDIVHNRTLLAAAVLALQQGVDGIIVGKSADDAKTTSREENVAGLSSAITLVNDIKAKMNIHYADIGGAGEEHLAAGTAECTAIAGDDADSIASVVALTVEIQDSYVIHDADAALATPVAHQSQSSGDTLTSAVNPTTLEGAITVLNDIKAKFNLHEDDGTAHSAGDSGDVAAADAAYGAAILVVDANVASGDLVSWSILNDGTGNVTGVSAVAAAGGITFTFSADPQNDCIISYMVLRTLS